VECLYHPGLSALKKYKNFENPKATLLPVLSNQKTNSFLLFSASSITPVALSNIQPLLFMH